MNRNLLMSCEMRRRAVVGGRAVDKAGLPFTDASVLVLTGGKPPRRFNGQMRRDGSFFFLDVPAGAYTLSCCNASGHVLQTKKVVVPQASADAPLPLVSVDLKIVDQVAPIQ